MQNSTEANEMNNDVTLAFSRQVATLSSVAENADHARFPRAALGGTGPRLCAKHQSQQRRQQDA
jgi:hypothetical protein